MTTYSTDELAEVIRVAKAGGKIVGLCHGCFDIVHIGHIRHFAAAKKLCDVLFVSVTADRYVNKGPDRPVIPEGERAEVVASLKPVSGSIINQFATATSLLERILPSIYFKGQEYEHSADPRFLEEKSVAAKLGIDVRHTFEKVHSSSKIIFALKKPSADEVRRALDEA